MAAKIKKLANRESGAVLTRLHEIKDAIDPRSPRMTRFRSEVTKIRKKDNEDMVYSPATSMAGEDRHGRPLAKPADSTVKGYERKGEIRQVLAPHGLGSRVITKFFTEWTLDGRMWSMVDGWRGIDWIGYHLLGCPKGSKGVDRLGRDMRNWSLPQRDIGGWSLKGLVKFREAFARLRARVFEKV